MEAAPSSAKFDALVRATNKACAQRMSVAPPDTGAGAADWSCLPEDLLLIFLAVLDVPSLICSGAVCTSWRDACKTFRLAELKQAPCLLYACDEYGPSDAALYCPSIDGATFRVPLAGPPHEKRGFVFSCNGLVFAANEVGDPYLFNPITGVQASLPALKTIMCRDENFYDDEGKFVIEPGEDDRVPTRQILWARHAEYARVAISSAAEVAACTVVIVHQPGLRISFARPGDKTWTLLPADVVRTVGDVLYNDKDGLFYILHSRGSSISTLDLSGPLPSVATIMDHVTSRWIAQPYLALTPSGQLLQVWRMRYQVGGGLRSTRQDVGRVALQDCIDLADEDGSHELNLETNCDDEDCLSDDDGYHDRVSTTELIVFKVDIDRKKLVELRDIGGHTLLLGFNATVCLPAEDFPPLEPNCAYLTDDYCPDGPLLRKDHRIWNMKKRSMQKLAAAWPNVHSWLDTPAPIWITPRF